MKQICDYIYFEVPQVKIILFKKILPYGGAACSHPSKAQKASFNAEVIK